MGFKKPADLEAFRKEIREFVLKECEPWGEKIEETRELPFDEIAAVLQKKGLFSMLSPREWGGMGMTHTEYLPILEEMSKTHSAFRAPVHQQNQNWQFMARFGTEEQKKRWLPNLCTGKAFRQLTMTESGSAGTGLDIKTTAVRVGDRYILNGQKIFSSNAHVAEPLMVLAVTDKAKGRQGISIIIIGSMKEPYPPGLTLVNLPRMMGNTGAFHGVLTLKDVSVPSENLLGGREGWALDAFLDEIGPSRVRIATQCLGISQRCLDLSVDFAKWRVTFGKPIAQRQYIQGLLADMATDIYALRSIIMDSARRIDEGKTSQAHCSMCKLMGIEVVRRVSDSALLIHGGLGYTRTYPVERLYRDARSLWFEEGTPSIHKLVISRSLLQ